MSPDARSAAALVEQASAVLFDFDGPICRLFADVRAADVAADLRTYLARRGITVPDDGTADPLAVLRMSARLNADIVADLHAELVHAELRAVTTAVPTWSSDAVIRTLAERGHKLAVVSNNSARAVCQYLSLHRLESFVSAVSARTSADPARMKPNPYLVEQALRDLNVPASSAVLVGDSITDVGASLAVGVCCIGYANKGGKARLLAAAGAIHVVQRLSALV